ncbi:sepiapterin reductase [Frankliniella occidentalis]|uniref:Sepiapterin reductase n=1 Tax=Frankliniella occidentalis TaxID=133901 RepID=A0A6J1SLF5_FRAOC|nr:sepiapterin reductase [Frankliniella occidentalis]XP_026281767.1 sepiapterin reductase [Frankliniella occidentalis]XP_052127579.1 sepiapterin reductase [Frankliniella occidentalis]
MPAGALQPFWGQKTFCVLTGASQGIGRQFAIEFGRKFAKESVLVLIARNSQGLQETKRRVGEANPDIQVICHPTDLAKGNAALFKGIIEDSLSNAKVSPGDFQLAFIVHNAGSLGDVGPSVAELNDAEQWSEFLALNITSTSILNSEFLKVFPKGSVPYRTVVNVTSLCAVQPFCSMGQYCVSKAAREMFFKVLAEEDQSLDVLSYSPGPVDTDMTITIINKTRDAKTRDAFVDMKEKKTIVTCEQTTLKAIQVLSNKQYKSGQRVDYFDEGY